MFKITGLSLDIHWKSPTGNLRDISTKIHELDTDLLLLPEMFATGFCMEAAEISRHAPEILNWMKHTAATMNFAVAGSIAVEDGGKFFNRFYFVKPDGSADCYDKRHLFGFGGEAEIYTSGNKKTVTEFRGIRFLLQVCYDLRFPVLSRNSSDYDVALYVANWPAARIKVWETLLPARAIENQAYVFGLNRTGKDGYGLHYPESSECYFADGSLVSQTSGTLVSAQIDPEKLQGFRAKFPFLKDADDFQLKI